MKQALGFLLIFLFCQAGKSSPSDLSGVYFSLRGSVDSGSTTYLGIADSLSGWGGEASFGWRAPSLIKFGLLGLYENLSLANAVGTIGPMTMIGYGATARFFFISAVFIEGAAGLTQANQYNSSTGNSLVANGEFYNIGPGLEVGLNENLSFELSVRVRNVIFTQGQFSSMSSIFYSAGLSLYLK